MPNGKEYSMRDGIILSAKEKEFFEAYCEAIDFTETGDTDQAPSGAALDEDFERESMIDCLGFYSRIECYLSDDHISQAGHDFWLTRNGHGTGFWDRDKSVYGDHSARFTGLAKEYGETHAYFEEYM